MTPGLSAALARCKDFLVSDGFVDVENASPECAADLLLIAREWAKTSEWMTEVPTEEGWYWYYGATYRSQKSCELACVHIHRFSKEGDLLMTTPGGMEILPDSKKHQCHWLRIPTPELPKESRP